MENAGYVSGRKSKHPRLPGYFTIYDRDADPSPGIDADERWIVLHEPSSYHIAIPTLDHARAVMFEVCNGSNVYDFGQHETAQ